MVVLQLLINVGDVLTYDLTGLNYNTTYYIYVTAVNSIGEGNASSVASITTLNLPVFSPTSGIITYTYFTPLVLQENFRMPTNYNNFNFYIYGGGGNSFQVQEVVVQLHLQIICKMLLLIEM